MRRFALPIFASFIATASPLAAMTIDPASPESAVLMPAQVLHDNDFKSFFQGLPAEQQAEAEQQWKANQANPEAKNDKKFATLMAQLLAPDAVEQLVAKAEPKLKQLKVDEISQTLMMVKGFLPMMLQQKTGAAAGDMSAETQHAVEMIQSLLGDTAIWIKTSGIADVTKVREAAQHLVAGAKALGIKDAAELQALSLTDLLDRLSPLVKELKQALSVYDVQVDKFLESVTATSVGDGAQRVLTVGFNAFGRPYEMPVKVEQKDGKWLVSKDNASGFAGLGNLIKPDNSSPSDSSEPSESEVNEDADEKPMK